MDQLQETRLLRFARNDARLSTVMRKLELGRLVLVDAGVAAVAPDLEQPLVLGRAGPVRSVADIGRGRGAQIAGERCLLREFAQRHGAGDAVGGIVAVELGGGDAVGSL